MEHELSQKKIKTLKGECFISLDRFKLRVEKKWVPVFGSGLIVDPGVELHIIDESLDFLLGNISDFEDKQMLVKVVDKYLPSMLVFVNVSDLLTKCQRSKPFCGPRVSGNVSVCNHKIGEFKCKSCIYKYWINRVENGNDFKGIDRWRNGSNLHRMRDLREDRAY